MKDALTLANINMFAVLRNLEDLCELDKEAKSLIEGTSISIQFIVRNGPNALLSIKDGRCTLTRGTGAKNITLFFKSPEHFNAMVDGKANPIPLKGFTKISFLTKDFTQLTNRLSYYLKPTKQLLEDQNYKIINTILTFYTAFFAIAEIGNHDKIGKLSAKAIPNGIIQAAIENGPSVNMVCNNGHLNARKGIVESPRARMIFNDMDAAYQLLNGKTDSYTAIASGSLRMNGFLPMLDNLNHILFKVPFYLK